MLKNYLKLGSWGHFRVASFVPNKWQSKARHISIPNSGAPSSLASGLQEQSLAKPQHVLQGLQYACNQMQDSAQSAEQNMGCSVDVVFIPLHFV